MRETDDKDRRKRVEHKFTQILGSDLYGNNPYTKTVLHFVSRMLTSLDRDPDSPTYGCFDRLYWHYKVIDFPDMVMQQPSLALAQLYMNNFEKNIFYGREEIRRWAIAAVYFWHNNIHSDGTSDEYWPHEHGYPPTVFALFACSETYRMLVAKTKYDKNIIASFLQTAKAICRVHEKNVVNQEIASIAALYSVYCITEQEWLLSEIKDKLAFVAQNQSSEGWFTEYGGADIGYLSVALDYLGQYYLLSKDKSVLPIVEKCLGFIKYFIHPDRTAGGQYGSRNTEYVLPAGLEIFASEFPLAGSLADFLSNDLDDPGHIHYSFDDRYLGDYMTRSFVSAMLNYSPKIHHIGLPFQDADDFIRYFPHSGLAAILCKGSYIVVGLSKGGVIRITAENKTRNAILPREISSHEKSQYLTYTDNGYRIRLSKNRFAVTDWSNPDYKYGIDDKTGEFFIKGTINQASFKVSKPIYHTALRVLAFFLRHKLVPVLKDFFISGNKKTQIGFERRIRIMPGEQSSVMVRDRVWSQKKIGSMTLSPPISLRYVPSSKFFNKADIQPGQVGLGPNQYESGEKKKVYKNFREIQISKQILLTTLEEKKMQ